jgi:hypothetical protein
MEMSVFDDCKLRFVDVEWGLKSGVGCCFHLCSNDLKDLLGVFETATLGKTTNDSCAGKSENEINLLRDVGRASPRRAHAFKKL